MQKVVNLKKKLHKKNSTYIHMQAERKIHNKNKTNSIKYFIQNKIQ